MEAAYYLFRSGRPEAATACEEQEEDIGSPSESSESSSPSTSGESSELDDDASSSSSTTGSDRFEMSGHMTELPFKRGLSRFFDSKSESFASLAAVGSLEDLAKPPRKRLKPSPRPHAVGRRRAAAGTAGPGEAPSGGHCRHRPRGHRWRGSPLHAIPVRAPRQEEEALAEGAGPSAADAA
ncbi:hypothetical protein SEVIR_2G052032v4 [Setaria viridis]|uniref:Uncharacterized protein n=1 Tax=Setaria viridis TaxID=4556 RepID=A0A4V6DAQ7_SETVI|nr:uncharacterized protein LOC117843004 [Setaria viridis]TKW30656.1 hypothetical protein SEVIR_2G052032v2 [Setaria viridis]